MIHGPGSPDDCSVAEVRVHQPSIPSGSSNGLTSRFGTGRSILLVLI